MVEYKTAWLSSFTKSKKATLLVSVITQWNWPVQAGVHASYRSIFKDVTVVHGACIVHPMFQARNQSLHALSDQQLFKDRKSKSTCVKMYLYFYCHARCQLLRKELITSQQTLTQVTWDHVTNFTSSLELVLLSRLTGSHGSCLLGMWSCLLLWLCLTPTTTLNAIICIPFVVGIFVIINTYNCSYKL